MKDLFRKEALEGFSSNSGMSKSVRAARIRSGVFTALLFLCTLVFFLWLIWGTIYETVPTNGIIWSPESGGAVYAATPGIVTKTVVSVGSSVNAGDVLAVIPREDLLKEIQAGKAEGLSEQDIRWLYEEYERGSMLRSHISGIVTEIADENTYIQTGEKVASVVPYDEKGNNKTLIAFVPARNNGLISVGMEVQVTPDFAPREQYGYIRAYISRIDPYPVLGQTIKDNRADLFIPSLDERESYLQLEITFFPDAKAPSHLKWSNSKSGGIDVALGTMCRADIVVKKCHPYEWLFRRAL